MIEFVVEGEKAKKIIDFETKMFEKYKDVINLYLPLFNEKGYTLKLEMQWKNFYNDKVWDVERIPMKSGYECHIYCIVEKNGEQVVINSNDGEADYYPLLSDWKVDFVYRHFHRLKVVYYSATDDVDEDLKDLLSQLKYVE